MSLYINTNSHPNLFKNTDSINEPNQAYFKRDYLKELLAEQNNVNETFQQTLKKLRISMQKQQYQEAERWRGVTKDMEALKEKNGHHEAFEKQTREWMMMLENNSKELHRLVAQNSTVNQDLVKEINRIHQANEDIMQQLMNAELVNQQLAGRLDNMLDKQEVIAERFVTQDDKQDKVLDQLDNQEALMEKSYRQLNNLRSILFERTGFIADKIEESYKLTSSVLYKFLTGSEKPLTAIMLRNQQKENNKQND